MIETKCKQKQKKCLCGYCNDEDCQYYSCRTCNKESYTVICTEFSCENREEVLKHIMEEE